jgi:hypothetical protein
VGFTVDDSGLYAGLEQLLALTVAGLEAGLAQAANVAEALMHDTHAHGDITGATRASYRVYLIGGEHTGAAEAASGYAAAEAAISAAEAAGRSHGGQALSQDAGVAVGPSERGLIYTSFTDYQDRLEIDNAGQKAVLGPTLQATAEQNTERAAAALRERLGG